jgi:hypothetical protein
MMSDSCITDAGRRRDIGAHLVEAQELGPADHHGGAAPEAVQDGHHLRHRRHRHRQRRVEPQRRSDHHAREDHRVVDLPQVEQRDDDRQHHARARDQVALPRRGWVVQPLQPDDEKDGGDEIEKLRQPVRHHFFSSVSFALNIASMRLVTA